MKYGDGQYNTPWGTIIGKEIGDVFRFDLDVDFDKEQLKQDLRDALSGEGKRKGLGELENDFFEDALCNGWTRVDVALYGGDIFSYDFEYIDEDTENKKIYSFISYPNYAIKSFLEDIVSQGYTEFVFTPTINSSI